MAIVQKSAVMATPPRPALPQFHLFSPSGNRLQVDIEHDDSSTATPTSSRIPKTPKTSPPPMYRYADTLYIMAGEDVFPLPKEMEVYDWGSPNRSLLDYTDIPLLKSRPDPSGTKSKTTAALQKYPSLPAPIKEACSRIVHDQDPAPAGDPTILTHWATGTPEGPDSPGVDPSALALPGLPSPVTAGTVQPQETHLPNVQDIGDVDLSRSTLDVVPADQPLLAPSLITDAPQPDDPARSLTPVPDDSLAMSYLAIDDQPDAVAADPSNASTLADETCHVDEQAHPALAPEDPDKAGKVTTGALDPDKADELTAETRYPLTPPRTAFGASDFPVSADSDMAGHPTPPLSPDQDDSMVADTTLATVDLNMPERSGPIAMRSLDCLRTYFTSPAPYSTHADDGEHDEHSIPSPRLLRFDKSNGDVQPLHAPAEMVPDVFGAAPTSSPASSETEDEPVTGSAMDVDVPMPPQPATPPTAAAVYQQPRPMRRPIFPLETSNIRRAESVEITPPPLMAYNLPPSTGPSEAPTPSQPIRTQSPTNQLQQALDFILPKPLLPVTQSQGALLPGPPAFVAPPDSPKSARIVEPSPVASQPPPSAPSPSEVIWRKSGQISSKPPARPQLSPSTQSANTNKGKAKAKFTPPARIRPTSTPLPEAKSASGQDARKFWLGPAEPPGQPSISRRMLHPQLQAPPLPGPSTPASRMPLAQVAQEPANVVAGGKRKTPSEDQDSEAGPQPESGLVKKSRRVDISSTALSQVKARAPTPCPKAPETPAKARRPTPRPTVTSARGRPRLPTPRPLFRGGLLGTLEQPQDEGEFLPMSMPNANVQEGIVASPPRMATPMATPGRASSSHPVQHSPGWVSRQADQVVRDIARSASAASLHSSPQPAPRVETSIEQQPKKRAPRPTNRRLKTVVDQLKDDLSKEPETARRAQYRSKTLAPPRVPHQIEFSPDPIDAFDPMNADPEALQIKQEDLAENSAAVLQADEPVPSTGDAPAIAPVPRANTSKRPPNRLYSPEETECLIGFMGGSNPTSWVINKIALEEVHEKMAAVGYRDRSASALMVKVRDLRKQHAKERKSGTLNANRED